MNTVKEFMRMQEITNKYLSDEMIGLQATCNEYPDIATFVQKITYPMFHPDKTYDREDMDMNVARCLSDFLYQLYGLSIYNGITNKYHFNISWASDLNSFIGNYFLDDSYFLMSADDCYGCWQAKGSDEVGSSQNPLVLIAAAEDNANFYYHMDKANNVFERIRGKMKSSGKVEELLKR